MRKLTAILMTGAFISIQLGGYVAAQAVDIAGTWSGVLKVSDTELQLVVRITKNADGSLTGKVDSPDQGVKDIPVARTTFKEGKFHLDLPTIKATFEGVINDAGTELAGEWKQGANFPLTLKRTTEVRDVRRPQDPQPPFPYNEEEVFYVNKDAGVKLAGTLTTPQTQGPFPAVILISGSGAQDRNETLLNHHPFWVIADDLTRRGIAVLRVDDRGVGGSTGSVDQSTSADFAGDVLAGVEFLKERKEINPRQIGLIGHSEGGLIAPMVAVRSKDVAFIVLLAGSGLKGDVVIRKQTELLLKTSGGTDQDVVRQMNLLDQLFAIINQETDSVVIKTKIHELAVKFFNELNDEEKQAIGNKAANLEASLQALTTPWYRFFMSYDPIPTLKKATCPVLALNGSKDLQVSSKENLAAIEAALKEGGNKDFTVMELPNLNHLFQNCTTGLPSEYGKIEETFAPDVLTMIGDWIRDKLN